MISVENISTVQFFLQVPNQFVLKNKILILIDKNNGCLLYLKLGMIFLDFKNWKLTLELKLNSNFQKGR